MKNKNLLNKLSALGFSLFEAEEDYDVNLALADVVKSKDLRLWEGFPVILANSSEKKSFNYEKVNQYLKNPFDKHHFVLLTLMSLALYKTLNLKFFWAEQFYKSLSQEDKNEFMGYVGKLKKNLDLNVDGHEMSSQRLKATFSNYFKQARSNLDSLLSVKEELGLEYSLSQIFSPKQKELFLKKLRNEKLTKTEREYFSRVVKKKVLALANHELHRLTQKLLE